MKGKALLLVGGAVGYVLGSRAGEERYRQIKAGAGNLWNSPQAQQAREAAQEQVAEKAPEVKQAVSDAASAAAAKVSDTVRSKDSGASTPTATKPTASGPHV